MTATAPILDPRKWVEAFVAVPLEYRILVLGIIILYITFRYWPWRKKNGS